LSQCIDHTRLGHLTRREINRRSEELKSGINGQENNCTLAFPPRPAAILVTAESHWPVHYSSKEEINTQQFPTINDADADKSMTLAHFLQTPGRAVG